LPFLAAAAAGEAYRSQKPALHGQTHKPKLMC
jgi:hypothetical protein